MEGHIIRKRSGRKITMLATSLSIGILLVGGLLLYLSSGVRDAWSNFSIVSAERTTLLLYASNIDLAKTSLQLDLPIHEVDGLVRIDDTTPALNALGVLQEKT
ncbi:MULTISPECIES: hypothetical protein [unclassified Neptuniibacter]|uniref:hypothetical protein n=1 Tax=unclassified Neptuniibacter TaxID=2630693 RepID=UPI0025D73591|nr:MULTISPECIES: hypothetical protein [unclassified Neptuniibacter]|tara:strand:- start:16705 stop:17013 length:309 start_codon:yes stop_codon:yes gene_type:complete